MCSSGNVFDGKQPKTDCSEKNFAKASAQNSVIYRVWHKMQSLMKTKISIETECVKRTCERQQWRELVWSSSMVSDLQE